MAESRPYENKAHRAAKLIVPRWPGWKHLREKLQYAAYYDVPKSNHALVFAYAHSPMRPTGWMELFQFQHYKKIEGLFETDERYQNMMKKGKLTEFGMAPSLRGPRPSCVKSGKNEDGLHEDDVDEKCMKKHLNKGGYNWLSEIYREKVRLEHEDKKTELEETMVSKLQTVIAGLRLIQATNQEVPSILETWLCDEALRLQEKLRRHGYSVPPMPLEKDSSSSSSSSSSSDEDEEDPIGQGAKPLKPEINYRNLEELALRFHKEHSVASDQLKDTLAAMAAAGWRFCNAIEERGLPSRYYAQFTAAVRGGTIYTPEYFEQMRVDQLVETRGRPRKRARAVEASPCEAEAAKPEEHEHQEDKENKERRAQASAAAAARAMLAVRAAWGGKK
jgi:hypothetical protein